MEQAELHVPLDVAHAGGLQQHQPGGVEAVDSRVLGDLKIVDPERGAGLFLHLGLAAFHAGYQVPAEALGRGDRVFLQRVDDR